MSKRNRGLSLLEVLVAAGLALVLSAVVWASVSVLRKSTTNTTASQEPRKHLRNFLRNVQNDIREASFLFPSGKYDVLGHKLQLPGELETGNALAFAAPQTVSFPTFYSVVMVHPIPRDPGDTLNPEAHSIRYVRASDISTPSGLPAEIDIETLTPTGSLKTFDVYLADAKSLVFEVGKDFKSVKVSLQLSRKAQGGSPFVSKYQTRLSLRNSL